MKQTFAFSNCQGIGVSFKQRPKKGQEVGSYVKRELVPPMTCSLQKREVGASCRLMLTNVDVKRNGCLYLH